MWARTSCTTYVLILICLASILALGQVSPSTGAIRGIASDPSGAVIAGATVTLTNANSSFTRQTTTGSDGAFLFPMVPPASGYAIRVEAKGFAIVEIKDLSVRVTEVTDALVSMKVQAVSQEVVVASAAEVVQTANPTTGGTLTETIVPALPLNTRNPLQLLATDAGVTATPGSTVLWVAGSRSTQNSYMLNGVDATNFEWNSISTTPTPNPDAVQEFRTQTSMYDASTGRSSGGAISLISRSGTNRIHGTAYWFNRNSALAANDFFYNRNGQKRPFLNRNHFGGSLGGPVGGKTYYFFNYEGWRQRTPTTVNTFMPVLPTTRDAASLASAFGLPETAIDPVAVRILNLPGPYGGQLVPSGTGTLGTLGTYFKSAKVASNLDMITARVDRDWKPFGQDNRISVVGFWSKQITSNPIGGNTLGTGSQFLYKNPNISIADTHIFSPRVMNEFTIGATKNLVKGNNRINTAKISDVGMTRFNEDYFPWLPTFSISGQSAGWGAPGNSRPQQVSYSYTLRDTVSWSRGKQNLRFGYEMRPQGFNYSDNYLEAGALYFNKIFANAWYGRSPLGTAGNLAFRDFLIGAPYQIAVASSIPNAYYHATDIAGFVQDDWRFTRRLTLNLGLRWEFMGNVSEKYGHIATFDPSVLTPACRATGGDCLLAGLITPATPGVSDSLMLHQPWKNFMPRFGFGWDVLGNGKLALRGGYGIYFSRISAIGALQTNGQAPFAESMYLFNTSTGFGRQIMSDPFPTLPKDTDYPIFPTMPTLQGLNPDNSPIYDGETPSFTAIDRNSRTPYMQTWNLTTQWEFQPKWTMELGYLGSRGLFLPTMIGNNTPLLRNSNSPGPFGLVTNSADNADSRVPIIGLCGQCLYTEVTSANSYYNALLLTITHQFARGLYLKAAYTYSRSIDNNSGQPGFDLLGPSGNQYVLDLNRGVSDFNVPQQLKLVYQYNIPTIPRTKDTFLKHIVGGWSVTGLTTLMNGMPFSIYPASQYYNFFSEVSSYATVVPGCSPYTSGTQDQKIAGYINGACFGNMPILEPGATFGPLSPYEGPGNQTYTVDPNSAMGGSLMAGAGGRNIMRSPNRQRWDVAIAKDFDLKLLGEQGKFQFRGDFFNLFNTPNFSAPSNTSLYTLSTFGKITSTADIPRQIQLSLRISF